MNVNDHGQHTWVIMVTAATNWMSHGKDGISVCFFLAIIFSSIIEVLPCSGYLIVYFHHTIFVSKLPTESSSCDVFFMCFCINFLL